MTPAPPPPTIGTDAYPALFRVADEGSTEGQRTYRLLVLVEIAFTLTGAFLATAGAFLADAAAFSTLATVCLLASMGMKVVESQSDSNDRWFDGRAVAETVKTQAWKYMMGLAPYQDDARADRALANDLLAAMHARPDLGGALTRLPADPRQITPTMRAVRALSVPDRRRLYVEQRLLDQANWYRRKAVSNRHGARRWFWISLIGQGAAAAIAFWSIVQPQLPVAGLIGFFAAVATAATAWAQLGRHDELRRAYSLAYQELITIATLAERAETQEALNQLVLDGEGAISREHTMWMAKRELATQAAPATVEPTDEYAPTQRTQDG